MTNLQIHLNYLKGLLIVYFLIFSLAIGKSQSKVNKQTKSIETAEINTVPINSSTKSYQSLDFAVVKENSNNKQSFIIDKECAIEIMPDSVWLDNQQKKMPADDLNTIELDNMWYLGLAMDTLQKQKIKIVYFNREKRYIKFIKRDKSIYIIDSRKFIDAKGLILFNSYDNPVLWRSTDINDGLKDIYKR